MLVALAPGCWRDPDPERTAAAHAQILADAQHHEDFEGEPFSLIGSCKELERVGECSESWERDEHVRESRHDAYGRSLADPVVSRKRVLQTDCERRGGAFVSERCPAGALADRFSGTSEARKNVVKIEYFYTPEAISRVERSCAEHPRPGCALRRL